MATNKDLNISPYYDDFDASKNFYKVLFKPGFPVQARELTTLQSILQNQIKDFGSHMFKEGSMVIPGDPTFDNAAYSVKVNSTQFGIDISLYTSELIGKTVEGQISGVSATVDLVALPDGGEVEDLTLFVKYESVGRRIPSATTFIDGESLIVRDNVTYGNTTINSGTAVATLISNNASFIGCTASVLSGVYFIRGTFVNVTKQTIILDHYTNDPSYRVGFQIDETIINAKDDPSLYDNAKGFTNYAAPGADRFKIGLTLTKKLLTDKNDTDFVEILRTSEGTVEKIVTKSDYNLIRDWIAERTYDESGNYTLQSFDVSVSNSLNDRLGNGGQYYAGTRTSEGNIPSDDLMCYKVSGGEAYVKGYDVTTDVTNIIDVEKPRDTETIDSSLVPFTMGNSLIVNNLQGQGQYRGVVDLYGELGQATSAVGIIGQARIYSINSRTYKTPPHLQTASTWDLRLYDVQTYTRIALNEALTSSGITTGYHVRGLRSGAEGYSASHGTINSTVGIGNTNWINVSQTQGQFIKNEQIAINGVTVSRSIRDVVPYYPRDVKSVKQEAVSPYTQLFTADAVLQATLDLGPIRIASSTAQSRLDDAFIGVKVGDIVRMSAGGGAGTIYNKIGSISNANKELNLVATPGASGVYLGGITNADYDSASIAYSTLNTNAGGLFEVLPDRNISSVDFANSTLTVSAQITGQSISGTGITASIANVKDGAGVAISTAFFEGFSGSKYSVHYGSGNDFPSLYANQFTLAGGGSEVSFTGLDNASIGGTADSNTVVNVTAQKQGIQSKIKNYERSQILSVDKSSNVGSGSSVANLNDGLTYNAAAYGLRVQDNEISLNVPDVSRVLAVYESTDGTQPTFDNFEFTSSATVGSNVILGENFEGQSSGAVARVVTNNTSSPSSGGANKLGIIYLNDRRFSPNEIVRFTESNITTTVEGINTLSTDGNYNDITNSYSLDKGQREQYYDYSRIVRRKNSYVPSKRLLIVYDYYNVPIDDTGDVFSVLSYGQDRYTDDIPLIGQKRVRATDTLDFRPRVGAYVGVSSSPFAFTTRSSFVENSPKFLLAFNESTILGYDFYLPRIDKIYLDVNGKFNVVKGEPSRNPSAPVSTNDSMEIATLTLPPYLYNPTNVSMNLVDNRRYTMRDIGNLEDRIENLETVTTLSLLEVSTEALQVQDFQGRNRFKSGFFVDSFSTNSFVNLNLSEITVDTDNEVIRPLVARNTISSYLMPESNIIDSEIDFGTNYPLYDTNVQKTGDAVTLKYDEVLWVDQPNATGVENVNPFHVISFTSGNITLSPERDTWARTIRLDGGSADQALLARVSQITTNTSQEDIRDLIGDLENSTSNGIRTTSSVVEFDTTRGNGNQRTTEVIRTQSVTVREGIFSSGDDPFMRSRNVSFSAVGLCPFQPHYQFLDGNADVLFIPKLLEIASDTSLLNSGSSTAFQTGEEVRGYNSAGEQIISFRAAKSNHKEGAYNNPSLVYGGNPYSPYETIQAEYTSSSRILNVDTLALSQEAQGLYSGYVELGTKLVGSNSGAVAYVKNLQLIVDESGYLQGSFFLKDPNGTPPPSVIISTGRKTYKLSSSITDSENLPGSTLISSASTEYEAVGTVTRTGSIVSIIDSIENRTTFVNTCDPLAQSFIVGGNISAPDSSRPSSSQDGIFLTSVDVFFSNKPGYVPTGSKDAATPSIGESNVQKTVTVEIRTVELGTPTLVRIGRPVTMTPDQVEISSLATVATNVKFPEPIYLSPGQEYAVVILSPSSNEYEVFVATMGEETLASQSIPNTAPVIHSQQWAMGSLFKSQNGSIWSPSQLQDMKLNLYKAKFTSDEGSVFYANPTINSSNGFGNLNPNPVNTLSKTGQIGVTTFTTGISTFSAGTPIVGSTNNGVIASLVTTGSAADSVGIMTGGNNYIAAADVNTYAITGKGVGYRVQISSIGADGNITGIVTTATGTGYQVGDIVGIVTAASAGGPGQGTNAVLSVQESNGIDTLYLENINGTNASGSFAAGGDFRYKNGDGTILNMTTGSGPSIRTALVSDGIPNDGAHINISQFDHGMYSSNNKLTVSNVEGNSHTTKLSAVVTTPEQSTISVASTVGFSTFEGIPVAASNPGYVKIENEIIAYSSVGDGILNIATNGRGIDSTIVIEHVDFGSPTGPQMPSVQKYELNGVSLRRINKEHIISNHDIGFDDYYLQIDRTATGPGKDRSADASNEPQLSFNNTGFFGGNSVNITRNIQYDSLIPVYGVRTPASVTSATASIRTVSGTSIGGNEISFVDQGYSSVQLNTINQLTTPRLVCSKVNENEYLGNIDRNKSFITKIDFSTSNEDVSPIINANLALTEFRSNRLNNPVSDYATNPDVRTNLFDPHTAIYVSELVQLNKEADGLKVILSADRPSSSDFRVLYSLVKSNEESLEEKYILFPGYDNLRDQTDADGFSDVVIDPANNSGLPDGQVPASLSNQFLEYEFTADDIGNFTAYKIKIVMSGTNQAQPPRITDLRTIALK